ncbi:fluoride efflux transporter CrcB [Salibacterium salarium]|uniref:Fluoride-specific ion channel FluC n=1 Tax=Salibacterium salarium TaxID=284579 RepID=A0A3R9P547_9BACI|nr:fluoride efflux transporter CrcB [Salibacterium salarium]RSL33058.1 fluoride efflux transporter CrcB [Salibacterium salarium]
MIGVYLTIGGAMGAVFRYVAGMILSRFQSNVTFPIGMLTVNIIGSLGLGIFFGAVYGGIPAADVSDDPLYVMLAFGFFGAFTTFSTFSMESFHLLEKRQFKTLFSYIGLSVTGAVLCFVIGLKVFQL